MSFNKNLVKFISIIYSPKKYPLPRKKIVQILIGLFKNKKDRKLIYANFTFSFEHYYINNVNNVFEPKEFAKTILEVINYSRKVDLIWALGILYNSTDDEYKFTNSISKIMSNSVKKNMVSEFLYKEINKLKKSDIYKTNYYNLNTLKHDFETYKNLVRIGWELERIITRPLSHLLELLSIINKNEWHNIISKIHNPFTASVLNLYYISIKNKNYKILSKIHPNSSEDILSLAIINIFDVINQKLQNNESINLVVKFLLDNLSQLNLKRYYWYGIILSNMEYFIYNNHKTLLDIEKQVKRKIVKDIFSIKSKNVALKYLKQGLKITPRDTYYKHLDIWKTIFKKDKFFALKLAQDILEDYKIIIQNEQCHISLVQYNGTKDNNGVDYTNNLIEAITQLTLNNRINIIKLVTELLNNFHLTEEDYLYNSSKIISENHRVLHVFIIIFLVMENLTKRNFNIDGKDVNKYFEKFLNYINLHIWHEDDNLTNSIDNIFKLDICIENGILYKEIDLLFGLPNPPFKSLAILISKVPENPKTKEIKSFIEEYFDKYYEYWLKNKGLYKKVKMEKWYEICMILKDKNRAQICAETFPEYLKKECLSEIISLQ